MNEIKVAENKTLKLTNVLSREIRLDLLSIHFKGRMPFFGVLPPFTKRM